MTDTKERNDSKIDEARLVIFVPVFVAAVCAIFDGLFSSQSIDIYTISKLIYTYLFPSIATTIFTLLVQKSVYRVGECTIRDGMEARTGWMLAVYCVAYFVYLYKAHALVMVVLFGVFSIIFLIWIWHRCLDKRVTDIIDWHAIEQSALRRWLKKGRGK